MAPQARSLFPAPARRAALRQAGLLAGVACLVAAVSWAVRPDRLPLRADPAYYELELAAPLLDVAQALRLYEAAEHLFIDTRPVPPGTVPTIPASLPVRAESLDDDLREVFDFLRPQDSLILFGDGDLNAVSNVAGKLKERGFENLSILAGGFAAWRRAGGECTAVDDAGGEGG